MSNNNQMKRLDKLIKRVVFAKEERCYVCSRPPTDAAHVFVRNRMSTRWDERNVHALCRRCHAESHNGGTAYDDMVVQREGQEAYEQLRLESNQMVGNVHMFMDQKEKELNEDL